MDARPLADLAVEFYSLSRPAGTVISLEQCQQHAVEAARKYAAYGSLSFYAAPPPDSSTPDASPTHALVADIGRVEYPNKIVVGADCRVTLGEWDLIRPLFVLYFERENARALEASRVLGVEVYGRAVAEIEQDISRAEDALPALAFSQPILTV